MNETNNSSIDSEERAVTETGEASPPSGRATRMFGNSLLLAGSADTDGQGQEENR